MRKTLRLFSLTAIAILLVAFGANAQTSLYTEGADLSNSCCGSTFNISSPGTYTVSGTLTTTADGADWFQVSVGSGLNLDNVQYTFTGPASFDGGVNFAGLGSVGVLGTGSGSVSIAPFSYPLSSGTYFTQVFANFSVGNGWTITYTVSSSSGTVGFTNGSPQALSVCESSGATSITSKLTASDNVSGETLTWTTFSGPSHGSITGSGTTATSIVGNSTPSGISYTPTAGYNGTDAFTMKVSNGTTSAFTTINVTVNAAPAAITGTLSACPGTTTSLNDASAFGAWSSGNISVASVGSGTGVVTGVAAGTADITYTLFTGCNTTRVITVDPLPAAITGTLNVCEGLTTTLSDATTPGTWSSSNTLLATIDPITGVATGVVAGTPVITYKLPTGCIITTPLVVNPLPAPISGTTNVCVGLTTTLSDASTGGTWYIGPVMITSTATVDLTTGVVFGIVSGSVTVTYTLPTGCPVTAPVTVNPLPLAITGTTTHVCEGSDITLADATGGGSWSSSDLSMAIVDASTGVVTGVSAGTAMITYTLPTGCITTTVVTIDPLPASITGVTDVCATSMTVLTDATSGGAWSSSNTTVATVSSGVVSGLLAGTSIITYTLPTGCITSTTLAVAPLPVVSAGSDVAICVGSSANLNATGTPATYSWAPADGLSCTTCASPVASPTVTTTYTVTAVTNASGITYSEAFVGGVVPTTQCSSWDAFRASLLGSYTYSGFTIRGSNNTTGISCTDPVVATAVANAMRTGTPYSGFSDGQTWYVGIGCVAGAPCGTVAVELANQGTCSCGSGYSVRPAINNTNWGGIDGITCGASSQTMEVIFYTGSVSCANTAVVTVSVNPLPAAITGTTAVCAGSATALSDADAGGAWTSGNTTMATVNTSTGVVTGVSAGTPDITYTLPTGCIATTQVTVNPLPAAITGTPDVCIGLATNLTDATAGGTWTSSDASIAPVIAGTVNGLAVGTATISYEIPTGCIITQLVTVNPLPSAITGTTSICQNQNTTLSDAGGGAWNSGNSAIAVIGGGTGIVTGVAAGTAVITYTLSTGCTAMTNVTVLPAPSAFTITGGGAYCAGGTGVNIDLSGSDVGFTYVLYNGSTSVGGSLAGTGSLLSFGLQTAGGTYTIMSSDNTTGCTAVMTSSVTVVVDPLPIVYNVTGGGNYCDGGAGVHIGLSNSDAGIDYLLYKGGTIFSAPISGTTAALDFGLETAPGIYKITATNTVTGCISNMSDSAIVVVDPLVVPLVSISTSLHDTICVGQVDTFNATPTNPGSAPFYKWSVNGVDAGINSPTYTYTPANGDVVVVAMTSNASCLVMLHTATDELTMNTEPVYIPMVSIESSLGNVIAKGQTDTFMAIVTNAGPAPLYQWFVNNKLVAGANTKVYYSSNLANKDSVSCLVKGTGKCGMPTFNGVLIQVTTGVTELTTQSDIRVMPNPSNGAFTIMGTLGTVADQDVNLELTNMIGQVIYSNKVTATGGVINEQVQLKNTIANGMYLLNVRSGTDNKVFHIVIEQ